MLFSTHIALFLASMQREPASTVVIFDGGLCCSPGPSLSGVDGLEGIVRLSWGINSPGSTNVPIDAVVFVMVGYIGDDMIEELKQE